MIKIGIILGSTRPSRNGEAVAQWVRRLAKHEGAEFELVDVRDFKLPLLDEAVAPSLGKYSKPHRRSSARSGTASTSSPTGSTRTSTRWRRSGAGISSADPRPKDERGTRKDDRRAARDHCRSRPAVSFGPGIAPPTGRSEREGQLLTAQ